MLRIKTQNKFLNERCVVDGYSFPSKVEGKRYAELKLRKRAGYIDNLNVQFRFDLHVNGIKVATYVADFIYFDKQKFQTIIEDVKGGDSTPVFKLKKKMVEAEYGYRIVEIRYGNRKRPRPKTIPKLKTKCSPAYRIHRFT